ncbi:MAG: hypothetical protein ACM3UU_11275 [Ignavibacteriales bacterium]
MAIGENLICKVNCPDDMNKIYDIMSEFLVSSIYDEMDKNNLNNEIKKVLISELISKLENEKVS